MDEELLKSNNSLLILSATDKMLWSKTDIVDIIHFIFTFKISNKIHGEEGESNP